jgi:ATP-dependent protease Clp ATPase subunit
MSVCGQIPHCCSVFWEKARTVPLIKKDVSARGVRSSLLWDLPRHIIVSVDQSRRRKIPDDSLSLSCDELKFICVAFYCIKKWLIPENSRD